MSSAQKPALSPDWSKNYILKRIDEEDRYISEAERHLILKAMTQGSRFVQIGLYTLMVNTIRSIEPRYSNYSETNHPQLPYAPSTKELAEWNEQKSLFDAQRTENKLLKENV